jgi:hypothetical protein
MWMIQPDDAMTVTLYFTEFDTEELYDFVEVYDLATNELLASYSGSYTSAPPDPVVSPSGKMFVAFNTNYTQRGEGWTAYYEQDAVYIPESAHNGKVRIAPNPVERQLSLYGDFNGEQQVTIFNSVGQVVQTLAVSESGKTFNVDVEDLSPGVFIIRVAGDKNILTGKFVKQ